jgi:hypothetical protein
MNFIPSVSEVKIEVKIEDKPAAIESPDSNFDDRFGSSENQNFDIKREQSKTLTLLKLAKVDKNHEGGSAETLTEHDIKNI